MRYVSGHVGGNAMPRPMKMIDEICDERNGGGDWFVYLKPGWAINASDPIPDRQHEFGAETKAEIWKQMKTVRPCDCPVCHLNARRAK